MGTIFIFIGLVIILLLYNFNKAVKEDVVQIKQDGGLENKYFYLINTLKTEWDMQVINRTNTSVTICIKEKGVYVEFHILKAFNDLNVIWTMKNLVQSNSLKWKFNANESQEHMINTITIDIEDFNEKLYNDLKKNSPFMK